MPWAASLGGAKRPDWGRRAAKCGRGGAGTSGQRAFAWGQCVAGSARPRLCAVGSALRTAGGAGP